MTYAIIFFIIAFVIAVIVGNSFFPASNGALMLAFFFFFGLASLALCFLLSTFFSKAKLAAAVGAVLFIGAFFPYYSVNGPLKSYSAKFFSSLLAPVAFGLALDVVTTAEANGVGLTWGNLYTPLQGQYSFGLALAFLLFDFALYSLHG